MPESTPESPAMPDRAVDAAATFAKSGELRQEQHILIAMRKTLAAIVRDVTPPPGMKHPLSEATIQDVRMCLGLIAARERELAEQDGRGGERPYYADAPPAVQTVPITGIGRRGKA